MNEGKAYATAPLALFPVALVFVLLRSILGGDWRELFAAPYSALLITVAGYPVALAAVWSASRIARSVGGAALATVLAAAAIAEAVFWLLVSPYWQREFSTPFCVALVGACAMASALMFVWLAGRRATR